jgi:hypothetical protein
MVKRIFGWLAAEDHGDIFSICLTQRVKPGERLSDARARMRRKEKNVIRRYNAAGCVAGCSVTHMIWSKGAQGWHYHVHVLLEMPKGQHTDASILQIWRDNGGEHDENAQQGAVRKVSDAGAADPALAGQSPDVDFWTEAKNGLAAAVQYPVRDIAQGISGSRLGHDPERVAECVAVLLRYAKGWKLRRTWGKWRNEPPEIVAPAAAADSQDKPAAAAAPAQAKVSVGTVHRLCRQAVRGCQESRIVFKALEQFCRNNTEFGRRFTDFCRRMSSLGSS